MLYISEPQKKLGIVLSVIVAVIAMAGLSTYYPSASNQGYSPEQPMPFSHKIHAGVNKIPCLYCHSGAEKSKHALIPSMNVCMNCHTVVKTDSPWVREIQKHYKDGTPIEWVRVHELPDYVYFPHKRHVARGVACEVCHGPVQDMDQVYQASALTMGWCMECHRGQTTPKQVLQNIYPLMMEPQGPVAPVNCNTCHN
ncbi:cytochrome c3 family protein [Bdellovibrionota bacterium FG-1]